MFETLRQTLRDAMSRASSPAEGRAVLSMMRQALVEAKVGVAEIRAALEGARAQLEREQRELETVRRRGRLAAAIQDEETVRIAAQFEHRHLERVTVLEQKIAAQEAELALGERELGEMTTQFRAMAAGADPALSTEPSPGGDPAPARDPDALRREVERAAHEANAQRQLEELKRRMGR
jgi:hypothetical protein